MLAINLEPELEKHVLELVEQSGQSLDVLFARAIEQVIEDMEDEALVKEALEHYDPSQNISMDEMRRELGLDD